MSPARAPTEMHECIYLSMHCFIACVTYVCVHMRSHACKCMYVNYVPPPRCMNSLHTQVHVRGRDACAPVWTMRAGSMACASIGACARSASRLMPCACTRARVYSCAGPCAREGCVRACMGACMRVDVGRYAVRIPTDETTRLCTRSSSRFALRAAGTGVSPFV